MKKILLLIFILSSTLAYSTEADDIVGTWLTAEKKGHIKIYKKNNKYHGKLVWNNDSTKVDSNNPEESKRSRKLRGMVLLTHLEWNGESWENGYIYDPETGKTYNCKAELDGNNKLKFRGFVGVSLLGRTTEWTRLE